MYKHSLCTESYNSESWVTLDSVGLGYYVGMSHYKDFVDGVTVAVEIDVSSAP